MLLTLTLAIGATVGVAAVVTRRRSARPMLPFPESASAADLEHYVRSLDSASWPVRIEAMECLAEALPRISREQPADITTTVLAGISRHLHDKDRPNRGYAHYLQVQPKFVLGAIEALAEAGGPEALVELERLQHSIADSRIPTAARRGMERLKQRLEMQTDAETLLRASDLPQ
jgi:hypothetical protein